MFLGSVFTLLSGTLFGLLPLITVNLFASGLNTFTVNFFRYGSLVVIVLCYALIKRKIIRLDKYTFFKIVTHLGLMTFLTGILLAGSYNYISTGLATTLHFLYPVVVILISSIYYRENLTKRMILALLFTMIGIIFFLSSSSFDNIIGIVMAVASSATYAIYILQLERTKLNRLDPKILSFYIALTTSTLVFITSFFIEPVKLTLSFYQVILFVLLGGTTLFAQMLFQLGSRSLGSKQVALLSLSEPIVSMIVGIIFLSEAIVFEKIIGSIFILVSIVITTFRHKDSKTPS